MTHWRIFVLASLLAALLVACTSREVSPPQTFTEEEVVEALSGLISDINSVTDPVLAEAVIASGQAPVNRPGCPNLENVFELITFSSSVNSEGLTTLANMGSGMGTVLTRGSYLYDPAADACTSAADTDKLVLRYPYGSSSGAAAEAEVTIDWAVDSATLEVSDPAGGLHEVPTAMNVTVKLNGQSAINVDVSSSWYNTAECGSDDGILEPTRVSVSGTIGSLSLTDVGYSLDKDSLNVQGMVEAAAGISTTFDLSVNGDLSRRGCFIDTFETDTGTLALGVDSSVSQDSRRFRLDVTLSDAVFAEFDVDLDDTMFGMLQGIASVELSDGTLQIGGSAAARFAGSLNDRNGNGVSGEDVAIDFSAGDANDLESFLIDNDFGISPLPPLTGMGR